MPKRSREDTDSDTDDELSSLFETKTKMGLRRNPGRGARKSAEESRNLKEYQDSMKRKVRKQSRQYKDESEDMFKGFSGLSMYIKKRSNKRSRKGSKRTRKGSKRTRKVSRKGSKRSRKASKRSRKVSPKRSKRTRKVSRKGSKRTRKVSPKRNKGTRKSLPSKLYNKVYNVVKKYIKSAPKEDILNIIKKSYQNLIKKGHHIKYLGEEIVDNITIYNEDLLERLRGDKVDKYYSDMAKLVR